MIYVYIWLTFCVVGFGVMTHGLKRSFEEVDAAEGDLPPVRYLATARRRAAFARMVYVTVCYLVGIVTLIHPPFEMSVLAPLLTLGLAIIVLNAIFEEFAWHKIRQWREHNGKNGNGDHQAVVHE